MKIENLKYFLAVVRTGSLHKAAEELYLTPQNLSTIIRNIEHDAGEKLFVRTSKGMVLSAEGERFLPYAKVIEEAYSEYFAGKSTVSNILNFYTTPALASELTRLQGMVLLDRYYISVQRRSVADLREMMLKNMQGAYLMMAEPDKRPPFGLSTYEKILQCEESIVIRHKSQPITADDIKKKTTMIITQDYYEGNYGEYLRIGDLQQIKSLLRQKKAAYTCLDYHYNKNFQPEDEWVVVQKNKIPKFEMNLVLHGGYTEQLKETLAYQVRQTFL